MIKLKILTFFLCLSTQLLGQFNYCDSLNVQGHQTLFDQQGIYTTADFIKKYYPQQVQYFSNRNNLKPLNLWWNLDSTMVFVDDSFEVVVSFANKVVNSTGIFYPKMEGEAFSRIRDYRDGAPLGITSEDTLASFISSMSINGQKLPANSFFDLLNPNRYQTMLSIRPIQVFRSECGQYLFIYIFGRCNTEMILPFEAVHYSYMAKIIVSTKGQFVDRIVVPGEKLSYFGFHDCPYFIGF